ncbi:MAG: sulfite exporter TauE/SafE family protein, partial [Rhodobacteraceae bacterium]|nr:sulfite exporter TauE/SafE family protein [Paracoccaceae bacterium]
MEPILDILTVQHLALAAFVAVGAGMVKGIVGFAMPMIFVSGLSTFLAPELALA